MNLPRPAGRRPERPGTALRPAGERGVQPLRSGSWRLLGPGGKQAVEDCQGLVVCGSLLAHPRSDVIFGWAHPPPKLEN